MGMEYDPLDESHRINKSLHQQFNEAVQSGEITVLDVNTLQYPDGRTEVSRIYSYIFDDTTGEWHRVAVSRDEYYQKHGKGVLRFFKRNK